MLEWAMIRTPLVLTLVVRGNLQSASCRRLQFAEINKMNVSSTIRSDFQHGKRVLPGISS
jgi:hypothetical protein